MERLAYAPLAARLPDSFAAFQQRTAHQPVYVVLGVQGSGTNLLSRLLEQAFNFSLIEDGSFIFNVAARLGDVPSPSEIRRACHTIHARLFPSTLVRKTRRLIKSNTSFHDIDVQFGAAHIASGADLARLVYAYGAFRHGTDVMAIKSDDLWETIDRIDAVLPNRRTIFLTRDFRDNLLSVAGSDFGPIDPLHAARYVKHQVSVYEREYARTPASQRFHLRYEDLLDAPETVARRMSAHFGLPIAPKLEARLRTLNIRPGNTERWRRLSAKQLAHVEAVLCRELQTYGYQLASATRESPRPADWMMATAAEVVQRIGQKGRHITKRLGR